MKKLSISALVALTLALIVPAFAADATKGSKSISFPNDSVVEGKTLPAGTYKVEYQIQGQTAQVNFLQGKKTVVQVPATVISQKSHEGTALVTSQKNGATELEQIELSNQTLVFDQQAPVSGQ